MTSTVDIANFALNSLGANNISSFDENSKPGRLVNQRYDSVRDMVFRQHPWNCLVRRAELPQESTTPDFGYAFQYTLPTDPFCLRVLEFSNGTLTFPYDDMTSNSGQPAFVIEDRKLVTDEAIAKIRYIGRVTDPQKYDAGLIETLASALAFELAYAITGSNTVKQIMAAEYSDKLRNAKFVDATEGAPQKIEASDFLQARM
tara:strand:+ start:665 stop:1270 length:606 start_codon:yes stop_codon:yes gene_type:complete